MRLLRQLDFPLLIAALAIVLIGIIAIYSATYHNDSTAVQNAWSKQVLFAAVAFVVALAIVYIPEKVIYSVAYLLYLFGIVESSRGVGLGHGRRHPLVALRAVDVAAFGVGQDRDHHRLSALPKRPQPRTHQFL